MNHYVVARKKGTELVTGQGDLVFQIPDLDLAVDFSEWLMRLGWTVRLADSTEGEVPRNTGLGAEAVEMLSQMYVNEAARLQVWSRRRAGTPGRTADGRVPPPSSRP